MNDFKIKTKIGILHLEDVSKCFIASCVNTVLYKSYQSPEITWIINDKYSKKLLSKNDKVKSVLYYNEVKPEHDFDIMINFTQSIHPQDEIFKNTENLGIYFHPKSSYLKSVIYENQKTSKNIFQVYYQLINLSWKGQGYGITYYPKTKYKKGTAAILVSDLRLRQFVSDRLELGEIRVSTIPYRKNIFKRMDDINRYEFIITDDYFTMHMANYLRKNIHFLETVKLNEKHELFGNGKVYKVPNQLVM